VLPSEKSVGYFVKKNIGYFLSEPRCTLTYTMWKYDRHCRS